MNATHLHLILNHFPVLGTIFGLALLVWALGRRSQELAQAALLVFLLTALLTLPVYFTGEPAQDGTKGLPGVLAQVIEQHEEAAEAAFIAILVLGAAGLVGLFWMRRTKALPQWFGLVMVAGSLAVSGLMAWTANKGGQIRHTEIRSSIPMAAESHSEHRK